jgi:hypothetical protein
VVLKLNVTHQLLAYADDVNLLGDNVDTIKKNTETRNKCRENQVYVAILSLECRSKSGHKKSKQMV